MTRRRPPPPALPPAELALEVISSFVDGVVVVSRDHRILWMTPAAERITGIAESRIRGQHLERLFGGNPRIMSLVQRALDAHGSASDQQLSIERPGGDSLPVAVLASPWVDGEGEHRGAAVLLRDRSVVRPIEEVTRRGDRRAMVEALGVGLAHELRNPLGGIKGAAQLLKRRLASGRGLDECLDVIISEVERLDALVGSVLELGREGVGPREVVNIHLLLDEILAVHRADPACAKVQFLCRFDPSLPDIRVDVDALGRVFHNLVRNAVEAMSGEGTVTLSTSVSKDFSRVRKGRKASRLLEVDVDDEGPGIAAENRNRIFTPLYTTKPSGTGLGLPMALKIVEDHGGFLRATESESGGARIQVYLPFEETEARA